LGSPRRRSEKSENYQRESGKEDFHSAALLGQRLRRRHSLTVTIVQQDNCHAISKLAVRPKRSNV
jgi:hypothetical protein